MFRASLGFRAVGRKAKLWRKDEKGSAQRHFQKTIYGKKLDVQVVGGETGKEHGSENLAKPSGNILRRMMDGKAIGALGNMGSWLQAVRFTEWRGVAQGFYPAMWGAGFGVTQVMVLEAADMVVLNAPLVPFHLIAQFAVATWCAHGGAVLYRELCDCVLAGKPPTIGMTNMGLASAVVTHGLITMALLANMHPLVPQLGLAMVPLGAAYGLWRQHEPTTKGALLLRQLHRGFVINSLSAMGYMAVVGRFDPVAIVPMWIAGTIWTWLIDNVELLTKECEASSLKQTPYISADMKAAMMLTLPSLYLGFGIASYTVGQSFIYLLGSAGAVAYLAVMLDNMNLGDSWSIANTMHRLIRFGLFLAMSIVLGNTFWCVALGAMEERPLGTDAREPAKEKVTDTPLGKVLAMNTVPAERFVNDGKIAFVERIAKPALVHKHILQQQRAAQAPGAEAPPVDWSDDAASADGSAEDDAAGAVELPAYMRRERIVENFGALARYCIPAERVAIYESAWYRFSDHYNVIAGRLFG